MADHGVESVHGPVSGQTGRAGQRSPYQRRDDGVAGVFRYGLDDCPGDAGEVQALGVTAA